MSKKPALVPSMGTVIEKVDPPEEAGTLSVAEAAEIRERRRLIEAVTAKITEKQQEANDLAKVVQLLRVENRSYLEKLVDARSLTLQDSYDIDSESGRIMRIGRMVDVVPETEEVVPAVPEKNGAKE